MKMTKRNEERTDNRLLPSTDIFGRMFDEPLWPSNFFGSRFPGRFGSLFENEMPLADISETEKEIVVEADVPGFDAKNITVDIGTDSITIEGNHESEKETGDKRYAQKERISRHFFREFSLPSYADIDHAKCNLQNGTLTIKIPKKAETGRKKLQIEGGKK